MAHITRMVTNTQGKAASPMTHQQQGATGQDDQHQSLYRARVQLERAEQSFADALAAYKQNPGDTTGIDAAQRDLAAATAATYEAIDAASEGGQGPHGGGGVPVDHGQQQGSGQQAASPSPGEG